MEGINAANLAWKDLARILNGCKTTNGKGAKGRKDLYTSEDLFYLLFVVAAFVLFRRPAINLLIL